MRKDNIAILQETLQILEQGRYEVNGKTVSLKLTREERERCHVLLPADIRNVCARELKKPFVIGRCGVDCVPMDSYAAAILEEEDRFSIGHKARPVLVLNFANPVNIGGGVYNGARAQEEDLCRRSSLLCSLESAHAARYYQYNRGLETYMGSDAMIFSPRVEVFRDEYGELMEEPVVVAVLTCAAPMITHGLEDMSEEEYRSLFYNRIVGVLKCAAYFGYEHLVLGAWGCGAFGNDAAVVSDLFYKALKDLSWNGLRDKDLFRSVVFAVRSGDPPSYNYREFYRNFGGDNYYRNENLREFAAAQQRKRETEVHLDKIRGSLFGGAVGDALGYPVEFMGEKEIFSQFGRQGIRQYAPENPGGEAQISDDTQMTLFTAIGILLADTRASMRGIGGTPHGYVISCYQDWLKTQELSFREGRQLRRGYGQDTVSWLMDVPQLYDRRAPGNTCLSALRALRKQEDIPYSFLKHPQNNSKGCGGVMRVAPLGLKAFPYASLAELDREGAEIAAITHGHSLGYMTAAVLVHIISQLVYPRAQLTLKEIVLEAQDTVAQLFAGDEHLQELTDIINLSVSLAENEKPDLDNIHTLGEGWVAEETLAIAIYCSLRHQEDFSAGVIAAVNHRGDSDSTGAVTGNILGALLGYNAIDEQWKHGLELSDVILEVADDLCHGCQMEEYSHYEDPDWKRKYMYMYWRDEDVPQDGEEDEMTLSEFVSSPAFDEMNRLLRDGKI